MAVEKLIVDHIDTWTTALQTRSTAGRGSSGKIDLYGIKKLRELILELAVRGKLVPQDSNDEPASELLKRIAAEKAELVKQGKIKKPKPLPEISEEEKPFELPAGWEWVRLGDIGETNIGLTYSPNNVKETGTPVLRSSNIQNGILDFTDLVRVSDMEIKSSSYVEDGDLLICARNGSKALVGKNALISSLSEPMAFGAFMAIFRCNYNNYVKIFLDSPSFRRNLDGVDTTTINQITQSNLKHTLIPFPPEIEQEKIKNTVFELISLCDQLEQHSLTSLDAHQQLVETLLTTLTDSQNADELAENWARISEHFDTLFTTEASIDALKQTILQLAVMGKLVPQDPNDEPVEKLLSRAKSHQQKRIENKEIQKNKKIDGVPYPDIQIPKTSSFILLNELAFITKLAGFEYTNYFSLEDAGEVPVVRAQNVKAFNLKKDNIKFISYDVSKKLNRSALSTECLLMTFIGAGIGDTCIFEENKRWHLAPNVAKIEPFSDIDSHYLNIYLNSLTGRNEIFKSLKATAQPSLSMSTIREIMVILPPLQEQKRIVKKTNELLALCDKVNHYIQSAQQTQLHLADALTDAAIN
ncbi:restriction endonuclease subunit S [Citrobacter freundii]|uniref:restriction endonuclease subunit S n=1 Tax=Citrobacter freundii TaxID=546 RepID=UPI000B5A91F2|nr:restriction endonuclease subunit S [Citrobacter freundii]POV64967.1 type I restriction endonuclease subunit S [Citrobacter freundii complex sp. CFNIH11]ASK00955.1 type I restriction endonuclease subunit S [Citrobacter freundii]EJM7588358.1 restriction endonuclease subunit S [Citrobacter freundii]EJT4819682.1 restriction endonuclease subunit S [Citrobacter freundii]EKU1542630.1 restriction endonuclease subunit S [Citrobacter freundii]